jgi:tRNA threonylcarbamoyladenosine biosynthesis protein TsaB
MPRNRNILAIDSSTELASVCFTDGDRWIERTEHAGQRHSAIIMDHVQAVLAEARMTPATMHEVAFGAGPGSFTGLRIACGIAQGIGYGARVPVRAVSSLLAVAHASGLSPVIAAIDARMNEIYWAAYAREGDRWNEIVAPTASSAAAFVLPALPSQSPPGIHWNGAGNAFSRFVTLAATMPAAATIDASIEVTARAIADLALSGHGTCDNAEHAMPVYIRDKVAFTAAERAAMAATSSTAAAR